jgi:pyruvate/2-oxoglutarate dehydrogenase complex dihydrolipoamide dehydrogenase (E3) component
LTNRLTPDICVIGAGSGGLSVAAAAAMFGVPVVLVEKGKMGGDCLNYGCVPSKAMIASAKLAEQMRNAVKFGIADVEPSINFRKVNDHINGVIEAIRPNDSVERFTALGVKVIAAEARFRDAGTLEAGEYEIKARRFVIAAGSSPFVPPIPGIEEVGYLTNETIFEQTRKPRHLVVIGGGPIGIELAQAHRRLGCDVTVIEALSALGKDDPELAAIVLTKLRGEGVVIRENSKVTCVEPHGKSGVRVHFETDGGSAAVDGSHLLVAVGRKPNIEGLGLENARVKSDRRGIVVGPNMRTSNRRIYAIGDIAGGLQFTHVAGYHAGLVIRSILFRLPARENRQIIPWVTYTDPELAHIGMTEADARNKWKKINVLSWPLAENDRAQAEHKTTGLIKVVTDRKGRIAGASIVGANAGELISMWSLAISKSMTVRDLTGLVLPYPTMSEIGKRAAISYFSPSVSKPLVRWLIRFLRKFG